MLFMGSVKSGQKVILPPMYMRFGATHPNAGQYVVDPLVQATGSYAIVEDSSGNHVRTQMSPERFKNSEITGQYIFRVTIPGLPTSGQLTGRVHIYLVHADGQGGMLVMDNPCFSFFIDNREESSCNCLTEEQIRQIIQSVITPCTCLTEAQITQIIQNLITPCKCITEEQIIDIIERISIHKKQLDVK